MIGRTCTGAVMLTAALTAALTMSSCAGRQHLGEYSFSGKTIALTYTNAPTPILYSGEELNDLNPPFEAVHRSPERQRRSTLAPIAQARFDTAAATMNFSRLLASQMLTRATAALGASRAADPASADFVLDVDIERTAIEFATPNPVLMMQGTAILRDTKTGREVWRTALERSEGLAQFRRETGTHGEIGPILPAHDTPVIAYQRLLENLAQFAAIRLTEPLGEPKATASTAGGSASLTSAPGPSLAVAR